MGFKTLELKMRTDYSPEELQIVIRKILKIRNFTYEIEKQSLDGRNPDDIHWAVRVGVVSDEIFNDKEPVELKLRIPYSPLNKNKHVVIVGSGPAGIFAALVVQEAGFKVTLVEQGPEVYQRAKDIKEFEKSGILNDRSNYSFGEGGAGTFSDGKLTSRTKAIMVEKKYIYDKYVENGAPDEIKYLAKPHVGSNLLIKVVKSMRSEFTEKGGTLVFDNKMLDFSMKGNKVTSIDTEQGVIEGDYFIMAIGHSSYESYKLLMSKGVQFQLKNFAIGTRVEHSQELINRAKWKVPQLPGVKAADYSLTYNFKSAMSVYSFCMCPGGMVVPAPPMSGLNIVNGMSNYKRNYPFANSAIVSGISIPMLVGRDMEPLEALDWLIALERKFYDYSNSYKAPAVRIMDFMNGRTSTNFDESSYPFELISADFYEMFPKPVIESISFALRDFRRKINGFEEGVMLGLESRTSSPIQLVRNGMLCAGFDNLYLGGEGSGLSGGIISSAADGIKCAMDIAERKW